MECKLNLDINYRMYDYSESDDSTDSEGGQDYEESRPHIKSESDVQREAMIERVKQALEVNGKMRDYLHVLGQRLEDKLNQLGAARRMREDPLTRGSKRESDELVGLKFYNRFESPYFKDWEKNACPDNPDTAKKKANGELTTASLVRNYWTTDDLETLKEAAQKNRTPNWRDLSVKVFSNRFSPEECRKAWTLWLEPNNEAWTEDEEERLKTTAARNGYEDWSKTAQELGTSRSMFQCFVRFQSRINAHYRNGRWSTEEDDKLKMIIPHCTYQGYISWHRVCYYFETRRFPQIYSRWYNCLFPSLKKERFTPEEDRLILEAVYEHELDWKEIAEKMEGRNAIQVRERLEYQLKPQLNLKLGEWTIEEDTKLLELVDQFGASKWAEIAKIFATRNRVQIRHRYRHLMKKKGTDPQLDLTSLRRWKRGNSKSRVEINKTVMSGITKKRKIEP